jgi:hypothetical protein
MEAWIDDMVPDWDMSNDPAIHVDARSLDENSLRTLSSISPAISASRKQEAYNKPDANSPCPQVHQPGTPTLLPPS